MTSEEKDASSLNSRCHLWLDVESERGLFQKSGSTLAHTALNIAKNVISFWKDYIFYVLKLSLLKQCKAYAYFNMLKSWAKGSVALLWHNAKVLALLKVKCEIH